MTIVQKPRGVSWFNENQREAPFLRWEDRKTSKSKRFLKQLLSSFDLEINPKTKQLKSCFFVFGKMKKKEKIKLKVSYKFIENTAQLEVGFRILSKHFYENQEKITEKLQER